jgi:glycosyltransferase involved in cell wall biosynthesis
MTEGPCQMLEKKMAMRVVLLSFDFPEYCSAIASALAGHVRIMLVVPSKFVSRMEARLDDRVMLCPFEKPRLRQVIRQLITMWRIAKKIREFEPDVIHVQQGHLWWNGFGWWLRKYPQVITVHNATHHVGDRGGRKTPLAIYDAGFRAADQLITHGAALEAQLRERPGLRRKPITCIPHVAMGDERLPERSISEEEGSVLFFGRIWPYKGLDHLIRAMPLVIEKAPGAHLVIAGQGESFERYRLMMADPSRFEVHNRFVSNEERTALFLRSSVVVLPYIEASQSGVAHVAYALGKPVVATTVGGLPEVVVDGVTGLLVPPRDEEALAEAILRLLDNPELRRRFAEAGRRKMETECSPASVALGTLDVYRAACESHKDRARSLTVRRGRRGAGNAPA